MLQSKGEGSHYTQVTDKAYGPSYCSHDVQVLNTSYFLHWPICIITWFHCLDISCIYIILFRKIKVIKTSKFHLYQMIGSCFTHFVLNSPTAACVSVRLSVYW